MSTNKLIVIESPPFIDRKNYIKDLSKLYDAVVITPPTKNIEPTDIYPDIYNKLISDTNIIMDGCYITTVINNIMNNFDKSYILNLFTVYHKIYENIVNNFDINIIFLDKKNYCDFGINSGKFQEVFKLVNQECLIMLYKEMCDKLINKEIYLFSKNEKVNKLFINNLSINDVINNLIEIIGAHNYIN